MPSRLERCLGVAGILAVFACLPAPGTAQSTITGSLSGTVQGADGRPVAGALVTLTALTGLGSERQTTTTATGSFRIRLVLPGAYEVRVEVVGYRPLLARSVYIGGGDRATLSLDINPAPPPVVSIDTLLLGASSSRRVRGDGVRLGDELVGALPSRFGDLASVVGLSTVFDGSLGSQGLPGEMTLMIADGVPVYRADHPAPRAEEVPLGAFPRSLVGVVTARHNAPDVEAAGSAGGFLSVSSRASTDGGQLELDGAYSGTSLWSTTQPGFGDPSLLSLQGGLRTSFEITPGASQLFVGGDFTSQQTPLAARVDESLAGELAALDPDLLADLTDSGVETYERVTGLARVDVRTRSNTQFFARGAAGSTRRTFEGSGPVAPSGSAALGEETVDFSVAGGAVGERSERVTLEARGGISGSYRTFDPVGPPPLHLAGVPAELGSAPSAAAESDRTDFIVMPSVRYTPAGYSLKAGGSFRYSRHRMQHSYATDGDFFYSDAAAALAGQGYAQRTTPNDVSFATREFGLFVQHESSLGAGTRLVLGARYDNERIPDGDIVANPTWLAATGLRNDSIRGSYHQFGLRAQLEWSPIGSGTTVTATGAIHNGDLEPRAIYRLLSEDTQGRSTRYRGSGLDLPNPSVPGSATQLPTLTVFGPDVRPPRSTQFDLDVSQSVTERLTLHARGSVRRTDFLLRRRNLNLSVVPQYTDSDGRPVFGSLVKQGSLVTTTDPGARRFVTFGDVWGLDPDGWSEYRAVTVGFEAGSGGWDLYGSYTFSETTDNWVGVRSGYLDAALDPALPASAGNGAPWSEGISDYDVPHRIVAAGRALVGPVELSALYRFESGLPFTPRYRYGVDANGDGSLRNDVAFVPADTQLGTLLEDWSCLRSQAGMYATRNSCRASSTQTVDARLQLELARVGGRPVRITIDGIGLIESENGIRDEALLVVDPTGTLTYSPDGTTVTVPVSVNPEFGRVIYPSTRGRVLRIGLRIGA